MLALGTRNANVRGFPGVSLQIWYPFLYRSKGFFVYFIVLSGIWPLAPEMECARVPGCVPGPPECDVRGRSILDRSWTDPGSILDRSWIDPGSIQDRSWKLLLKDPAR